MRDFSRKNIEDMFSGLCCSKCKNDFSKDSLTIKKRVNDIYICNLSCQKCGKDFGDIVFRFNHKSRRHAPFEIIEGPAPISFDDVIDAHNFLYKNK